LIHKDESHEEASWFCETKWTPKNVEL